MGSLSLFWHLHCTGTIPDLYSAGLDVPPGSRDRVLHSAMILDDLYLPVDVQVLHDASLVQYFFTVNSARTVPGTCTYQGLDFGGRQCR
jgi:hypothetical protein